MSRKQIGTICFATIISILSNSAYSYVTNFTSCNNSGLGGTASSGSATVNAVFEANEIDLEWYNLGEEVANAQSTCIYDTTITPPTLSPRRGYTFGGWRIRTMPNPLLNVNIATNGGHGYAKDGYGSGNLDVCVTDLEYTGDDEAACSESVYDDLNLHDWKVTFSYGTVYGKYENSNVGTSQRYGYPFGTPDSRVASGDTDDCAFFCRVTGFVPTGGSLQTGFATPWVAMSQPWGDMCENEDYNGGADCADMIKSNSSFRRAAFGLDMANPEVLNGLDTSINGTALAVYSPASYTEGGATAATYGLGDEDSWNKGNAAYGVSFNYGKIVGGYLCATVSGNNHNSQWGGTESDWKLTESDTLDWHGSTAATYTNCWCSVLQYTPSGDSVARFPQHRWVFLNNYTDHNSCNANCSKDCAIAIKTDENFRNATYAQ